ncbi:blue light sensor protein [Mariprofundus erugo]|uniref:Blue light sensor protein n=1 Tax=Mariprofundus erugo TaxID=2528639 RepID=A0A5R9H330_9PROT|nr:BLUF domain-containing protein [Mariprofundus erugo]TLS69084.1 blue light sensor protein [Mariprofundus erugo]TLS73417.1 blue light sensor protein [Mariprofundus erugo]
MIRLVYVSVASEPFDEQKLLQLLAKSRANNTRLGISGQLIYSEGTFMQVLEGPADAVDATFERIKKDTRHQHINLIERSTIDQREFPEWSMGFKSMSREELDAFDEMGYQFAEDVSGNRRLHDRLFVTQLMKYVKKQHVSELARDVLEMDRDDKSLIYWLNQLVRYSVMLLAILMAVVVLYGVADVGYGLYEIMLNRPEQLMTMSGITSTFASFLAVLIAVDIFINISLYVRKHVLAVRLVVATALMAIARKIVVLEFTDIEPIYIFAMALLVAALGFSYYFLSRLGNLEPS